MRNAGLEEAQSGIKIAGRNINNLRYADDTTLKWRGTEEPLDESERGEWESWLKAQHSENEDHGIWSHHFMGNRCGNSVRLFFGLQNHCRWWLKPWNLKTLVPWKKINDKSRQHIKKQRHYFDYKVLYNQNYDFSSSHVWMWKLDNKKGWAWKNWCLWTVVEKTLESYLDSKEIQPVNPKGNQSWILIGRTYAKAEAPILWPHDVKSWLIGKDLDPVKDWGQEKKGMTEDEMVR